MKYTVKSGWPIVYIEGSQIIISKKYCISNSVENSADPNEMPHHVVYHLGCHRLPKVSKTRFDRNLLI